MTRKRRHEYNGRIITIVKACRKVKGIKQELLANALGMTPGNYSKLETNQRELTTGHLIIISDVLGINITDSLMVFVALAKPPTRVLKIKNLLTNVEREILTINGDESILGHFVDKPGQNIFYYTSAALFKVNINTRVQTKLLESCPKRLFTDFCISPFDGKLMACRVDTKKLDESTLYYEMNIFEFDPDGTNMKMIGIP